MATGQIITAVHTLTRLKPMEVCLSYNEAHPKCQDIIVECETNEF